MRSGFDPGSYDWGSEYYAELALARGGDFVHHTFASRPALVARNTQEGYRQSIDYRGQSFDSEAYDLVSQKWNHDTCKVCRFRIDPGHSYWETTDNVWILCDECYEHLLSTTDSSNHQPA